MPGTGNPDPSLNEKYLLCLLDRKQISVEQRREYDSRCARIKDLYKTNIFQLYSTSDSLKFEKIEAIKWYINVFQKYGSIETPEILKTGMQSENRYIKRESEFRFYQRESNRIEGIGEIDSVLAEYYRKLVQYDNDFFIFKASSFLVEHNYVKALPLIFKKIDNSEYDWFYYQNVLEKWDDETVTRYCINKLQVVDNKLVESGEIMWMVDFLLKRNYEKKNEDLEQLSLTLSPSTENIFINNTNPYPGAKKYNLERLLYIYCLSNQEWSAKLLKNIYINANLQQDYSLRETVVNVLSKRSDSYAKSVLFDLYDQQNPDGDVLEALSKIGGDSISLAIVDVIKSNKIFTNSINISSILNWLVASLEKSSERMQIETISYLLDLYKMNYDIEVKKYIVVELCKLNYPLVSQFLISEFEQQEDYRTRFRIVDSFKNRDKNICIPFLEEIISDTSENIGVRQGALSTLIEIDYVNRIDYLEQIVKFESNSDLKRWAIILIIRNNHHKKMELTEMYLTNHWLEKGFSITYDFNSKYFSLQELNTISEILARLYNPAKGDINEKFNLIQYLNHSQEINAQKLLQLMRHDKDRYVRDEALYTLIKLNKS